MNNLILWLFYALAASVYLRFISDTHQPFEMMVGAWIGSAIAFLLVELISFGMKRLSYYQWKREQIEAHPNCGACAGDGSMCKTECRHQAENPSPFMKEAGNA